MDKKIKGKTKHLVMLDEASSFIEVRKPSKSFKKLVEEVKKSPEYWKEMYELLREENNTKASFQSTLELSLLVKLGSIAVHAEELLSPKGHQFDAMALKSLLNDSQVKEWLAQMNKNAFLPVKR